MTAAAIQEIERAQAATAALGLPPRRHGAEGGLRLLPDAAAQLMLPVARRAGAVPGRAMEEPAVGRAIDYVATLLDRRGDVAEAAELTAELDELLAEWRGSVRWALQAIQAALIAAIQWREGAGLGVATWAVIALDRLSMAVWLDEREQAEGRLPERINQESGR